ncbi:hypothetical protein N864_10915 [Intrasporangium chromatireducens Q5-1]|uniref:Uncharacterized protein n=1 Tax=Intrasporangium chromatireducens Q5-1 TaxID=584657 RepID=W9GTF2_9MICO|nr:hypothetical protein N864_10915 [Intrasporangium chromatireducens Q5-1]
MVVAERMVLVLDEGERAAIARDLLRYGAYRQRVADDLVDAHVLPEPGEPDPPGITPQVVAMTESHVAAAKDCEDLAAAFESDDLVPLTPLTSVSSRMPWMRRTLMIFRRRWRALRCSAASCTVAWTMPTALVMWLRSAWSRNLLRRNGMCSA